MTRSRAAKMAAMSHRPVEDFPDFPAIEAKIQEHWTESKAFDRVREKNAEGPVWSFLDGPITANNPMGVHHAWGRSYKDIFQRYHAMNGKRLRYQNGFDCQGLWVEVEVEKQLGFKTKRDIVDYGIDKFVNACKQRVLTYAARQTEQSIRLGYWTDWDDPDILRRLAKALGSLFGTCYFSSVFSASSHVFCTPHQAQRFNTNYRNSEGRPHHHHLLGSLSASIHSQL